MRERIRQARKALNMTQKEFGKKLGLTQTTLSMIEIGESVIVEKNVKLICATFNISEHWLRTGNGPMFAASPYENEFGEIFCKLTADTQECLLAIARELLAVQQKLLNESEGDNTSDTIHRADID